ncbi:MAG: methyltransferase [Segetibacter sp.]|nr:methyltransferase [Segetibacter sp.]
MRQFKSFIYSVADFFFPRGITRNMNGTIIRFPAKWSRYFRNGYEKYNFEFAAKSIPAGGTAIDIGAHIGVFAVHLSKLTGRQGKVYAFEPSPYTFAVLNKVINLNKQYGEIVAYPFAISDKEGEINFNIVPGSASVANTMASMENTVPIKVKMISVDAFRKANNLRIDFLKIDAEGAEYLVLYGAKETFMEDRPKAHLGLHPWQIKAMGTSLEKIWDLLALYQLMIYLAGSPVNREWFCHQTELFDVELIPL